MPKISALNSIDQLTTSSILPVVDNNVTQKVTLQRVVEFVSASIDVTFATEIELLQSASSITSSLNAFASASVLSVASKLSTSSFEAYTASVSSANTSSLLLSSSFNTFTSSYKADSGSFDGRIDSLELINVTPFLSASTFNTFSSSIKTFTSSINESISSINSYTSSLKNAINVVGNGDLSVTTIYGNLHIEGTTTSVSASNLSITNNLIYLNDDNFVTNPDLGIVGNYNDGTYAHTGIFSDANDGHTWKVFKGYTIEPSQSIDTSHGSYQLADFEANNIYGGIYATNGVISGSQQITDLGFVTGAYANITEFNSLTQSFNIISGSVVNITNAVDVTQLNTTTASLNSFTQSANTRLGNLEAETSSYLTSLDGAISSSQQIVDLGFISSSADITIQPSIYNGAATEIISANGGYLDLKTNDESNGVSIGDSFVTIYSNSNIWRFNTDGEFVLPDGTVQTTAFTGIPSDLISSSQQITNFGFATTSSVLNIDTSSLVTTSSFNTFTSSINTTIKSKLNTEGVISGSSQILNSSNILSSSVEGFTAFSSSVNSRIASAGGGTTDVSMFLSQSVFNIFSSSINTFTSSANTALSNVYTVTASLNTFTSSYITHSSSFDSRINSIVNGSGFATTSSFNSLTSSFTTYSGSINTYTSSMNSYTASINSTTASLNSKTGSYATTGSNQFKADQTITGSLTVTALTTISSSISANSSSLYLSSGSNLYVQNNGLVEITGSLTVSGSNNINLISPVLQIGTGSGDEGGEILLAKAATNTSLTGSGITIDSYRDRIRIFEQGGDARGVHIDLSKTPAGVGGELIWKASGIVNAGTFVTLDNIKATVTTTSNRGLSLATVSGTVSGYISGHYQTTSSTTAGSSSTTSLSTSATTSMFSWNFGAQGDTSTYILRDDTNNRVYRITLMIGGSYNNNFISIERLY